MIAYISSVVKDDDLVLLVREEKAKNFGKWNLPGGHHEVGESFEEGAIREVCEETHLTVGIVSLLGVYLSHEATESSLRVVFNAEPESGEAKAGDEILEVRWFSQGEVESLSDETFVGNTKLVLRHCFEGRAYPTACLK